MVNAIETEKLVKKFGSFTAVDGLSLRIQKGELFGFLGPNGAGKTTTIRMLTTLMKPTSGVIKVAGFDINSQADSIRARIGVVPQTFALFEELSPLENLQFIGELYAMSESEIAKKSEELLKIVSLYDKRNVVSGGFSGGMKQRLSVASSLLHNPEILFMDEPTTGLDPQSRISLRELTTRLNKTGITVVYTTHDMEEADKLCDRIAIMDKGKVMVEGTSSELKSKYGSGYKILISYDGELEQSILNAIKKLVPEGKISIYSDKLEIHVQSIAGGLVFSISNFLSTKKVKVKELLVSEPTLEEVFINLTSKNLRD